MTPPSTFWTFGPSPGSGALSTFAQNPTEFDLKRHVENDLIDGQLGLAQAIDEARRRRPKSRNITLVQVRTHAPGPRPNIGIYRATTEEWFLIDEAGLPERKTRTVIMPPTPRPWRFN